MTFVWCSHQSCSGKEISSSSETTTKVVGGVGCEKKTVYDGEKGMDIFKSHRGHDVAATPEFQVGLLPEACALSREAHHLS